MATTRRPVNGRRPAARLFAHDRQFGVRRVAGADEAGRGCLAGPLVVAAVCLDLEGLTPPRPALAERPRRLEAPRPRRPRTASPRRSCARRTRSSCSSRARRRSTATASTARTCACWRAPWPRSSPARRSASWTASGSGPRAPAHRAVVGGDHRSAVHRRRVGDRQDRARPPHGRADGGGLSRLRLRPARRLRDPRAPRRAAGRGALAAAPALLPVDGLPGLRGTLGSPVALTGPRSPRAGGPRAPAIAPRRTAMRSRRTVRPARSGWARQVGLGRPRDPGPLGRRDRLVEHGRIAARLDLADGHDRRRARPPGRAPRPPRASARRGSSSPAASGGAPRPPRRGAPPPSDRHGRDGGAAGRDGSTPGACQGARGG